MLPHHHIEFLHFLTHFKIRDFNKEHTISLKMVWMEVKTFWNVF